MALLFAIYSHSVVHASPTANVWVISGSNLVDLDFGRNPSDPGQAQSDPFVIILQINAATGSYGIKYTSWKINNN